MRDTSRRSKFVLATLSWGIWWPCLGRGLVRPRGFSMTTYGDFLMSAVTYVSTVRKQGINVLTALRDLFEGKPFLPSVA